MIDFMTSLAAGFRTLTLEETFGTVSRPRRPTVPCGTKEARTTAQQQAMGIRDLLGSRLTARRGPVSLLLFSPQLARRNTT